VERLPEELPFSLIQTADLPRLPPPGGLKKRLSQWSGRAKRSFGLKPVTFRYKKGIDPQGIPQFGLVAEGYGKGES
jgi:hypothetical protein